MKQALAAGLIGVCCVSGVIFAQVGASCKNLVRYTYVTPSSNNAPCTVITICEDGDSCQTGTQMIDCGTTTVRTRNCASYDGVWNGTTCVPLGPPISPWAPGSAPDNGVIASMSGGNPCNSFPTDPPGN